MKSLTSNCFLLCLVAAALCTVRAFAPATLPRLRSTLTAGGFEWENPGEAFDQGVENPFKKTDLEDDSLKIDPARLLSPRMNGSNLYLVGMMGSGKSAVGKVVAKRKSVSQIT